MKMLTHSVLMIVLLALAACGADKQTSTSSTDLLTDVPNAQRTQESILGLWKGDFKDSGTSHEFRMVLEPNKVTVVNRCTFRDGQKETVSLDVSASVTVTSVRINEEKKVRQPLGCEIHFKPMTFTAELKNGTLTLTDPEKGEKLVLTKVRD